MTCTRNIMASLLLTLACTVPLLAQKAAARADAGSINSVEIAVGDVERAQTFYETVLGLKLEFYSDESNYGWFKASGTTLAFHKAADQVHAGDTRICFSVRNIKSSVAALRSHGVKITGDIRELPGRSGLIAEFEDPWGNKLAFFKATQAKK